jgi:hypothetical protein
MDAMASRNLAAVILYRSRKLSLQADFASLLSGAVVPFAVTGALLALLCITMGSWCLLREARTPLQHSPSR